MKKHLNILLLYSIPISSNKINNWVDGFTTAIDILKSKYNIIFQNIQEKPLSKNENDYKNIDLILVKANWNSFLENECYQKLGHIKIKKALLISGSKFPKDEAHLLSYDLLFYETEWYKRYIVKHPNIIHAFGIDSSKMQVNESTKKTIDYLSVGSFKLYKRLYLILRFKGKKLIIGEIPKKITKKNLQDYFIYYTLKILGIKIIDFMDYKLLSNYYNAAKNVYIPAKINGGGERAVLEARACGANVIVEKDNPKLLSLINSPIYNHIYYAEQLEKGINSLI
ncbi:MAG: hypothetical protein H6578_11975 [Chitinophagales bacterium]|nr:hypothetical protein [Chitinophagales bacterium]